MSSWLDEEKLCPLTVLLTLILMILPKKTISSPRILRFIEILSSIVESPREIPEKHSTLTSEISPMLHPQHHQAPLIMTPAQSPLLTPTFIMNQAKSPLLNPDRSQSQSSEISNQVEPAAGFPHLNFNDLSKKRFIVNKPHLHITTYKDKHHILKHFPAEERKLLNQELRSYEILTRHRCQVVPKLIAYVYDGIDDPEHTVGFVSELLTGRKAGLDDLEACKRALAQIHQCDIVHVDLQEMNNFIITKEGPRFFDFEYSNFSSELSEKQWEQAKVKDIDELKGIKFEDDWNKVRAREVAEGMVDVEGTEGAMIEYVSQG